MKRDSVAKLTRMGNINEKDKVRNQYPSPYENTR